MGLVWDPTLREPRPFRVMNGFSCEPTAQVHFLYLFARTDAHVHSLQGQKGKQSSLVALNEAGILTEIGRMGEGLITSMVQQT
jgi:U3 small nucleolar RNA-associated protein 22